MTAATERSSTQLDSIEPGQNVRITVEAEPRSAGARKTIERLMRRDAANAKGLRRAQGLRRDRTNSYIRGNRLFHARPKAARVVRALPRVPTTRYSPAGTVNVAWVML